MRWLSALLMAVGVCVIGCDRSRPAIPPPTEVDGVVRATSAPVGWLTERIAGGLVPVEMLCPEGQSPETWRPPPDTIARYQRAALIVVNGADLESWVYTAPLPRSRLVLTAPSIEGELLVVKGETHSHGPSGEHAHDEVLGHTWLDPLNATAQAGAIARALGDAFPTHAAAFRKNYEELAAELAAFDERLRAFGRSSGRIVASDNPLGYLARRYGWPTIESEDRPEGWPAQLDLLKNQGLLTNQATVLIVSDREGAASIADAPPGASVVVWETGAAAGTRPYTDILAGNIERLLAAIEPISP